MTMDELHQHLRIIEVLLGLILTGICLLSLTLLFLKMVDD